jgi:hypothetical protein
MRYRTLVLAAWLVGHGGAAAQPPKPEELPKFAAPVAVKGKDGLVTLIRPLVSKLAANDPLRFALHWEGADGPLRRDPRQVDWRASLRGMTFTLTGPDGKKRDLHVDVTGQEPTAMLLHYGPTLFLTLTPAGLSESRFKLEGKWKEGKPDLSAAGKYTLAIKGALVQTNAVGTIPFQTGVIAFELGVAGHQSTAAASDAAVKHLKEKMNVEIKQPVRAFENLVLEDAAGYRVVVVQAGFEMAWNMVLYYVTLKPDGAIVDGRKRSIGTCIAEGVNVATPRGDVPVEKLRAGDAVWGYDPAKRMRVEVRIQSIRDGLRDELVQFAGGLRCTPDHPIHVAGRWKLAGEVSPTDSLLAFDGKPCLAGKAERRQGAFRVYDLTVDGPHTFFAAGVLVHNKDRDYWPHVDDHWYLIWGGGK